MKIVAFIEGRPKPQPRVTQKTKFLFQHSVQYWVTIDAENARKADLGLLNKKGKPYKPTRYSYRLKRLQAINAYRALVKKTVMDARKGEIPYKNMFFVFLLHPPKATSAKKWKAIEWTLHEKKPDYSNLIKGVEDALYEQDNKCNAVAIYKLYAPKSVPEGLLIMENEEIHQFVIDSAIENLKNMHNEK
jgi:Holliday junction resolvase RusA-like endonuclease